jgi:nanoRNase/pAp phosphatase (c-di-AMP/oligoRNAs hydrolase)
VLTHKHTLYSHLAAYKNKYNPLVLSSVRNPHSMTAIIELGNMLTRTINAKIQQYIFVAKPYTITVAYDNNGGRVETYTKVYIINTTEGITSELGNAFMEQTDADFVIMWYYSSTQQNYYYSLRSSDQKVDVGRLAKQYGGGGHRNAAGISGPFINDLFSQVIL